MRTIKFRAFGDGEMDYMPEVISGPLSTNEELGEFLSDHYACEIMQFTGLLDKNGTEIYEGDILEYISANMIRHRDSIIYGEIDRAGFQVNSPFINIYYKQAIEVIGNIYENPELLKETT